MKGSPHLARPSVGDAAHGWRSVSIAHMRVVYALAALAMGIPLLLPQFPPLTDLPGHMARYAISLRLDQPSIAANYAFEWKLVGNIGFDAIVFALGQVMDVERATKLLLIGTVIANAWGLICLSKAVHGKVQPSVLLALPLIYTHSFMLGFVNYVLATALAIWGLWLWIRLTQADRPIARALVFSIVAMLVWAAHAVGWIVLGAICAAWLLSYNLDRMTVVDAIVKTTIACMPLGLPVVAQLLAAGESGGFQISGFLDFDLMAKWAMMLLRDRWFWWDMVSAAVIYGIIVAAIMGLFGFKLDRHLRWAALIVLSMFVFGPLQMNAGSHFVSSRLLAFACMLALVAINSEALPRARLMVLSALALSFATSRVALHTASFAIYDNAMRQHLQALQVMPAGSRIAAFAAMPCPGTLNNWASSRLGHLPTLAVVRKNAYIGTLWAVPGVHLLRIRAPIAKAFQTELSGFVHLQECPGSVVRSLETVLRELPSEEFEYIWMLDVPPQLQPVVKNWKPIWRTHDAIVYQVEKTR